MWSSGQMSSFVSIGCIWDTSMGVRAQDYVLNCCVFDVPKGGIGYSGRSSQLTQLCFHKLYMGGTAEGLLPHTIAPVEKGPASDGFSVLAVCSALEPVELF